jgi:hypothetical protein
VVEMRAVVEGKWEAAGEQTFGALAERDELAPAEMWQLVLAPNEEQRSAKEDQLNFVELKEAALSQECLAGFWRQTVMIRVDEQCLGIPLMLTI